MNHETTVRRILTNAAKLVDRSTPERGHAYSCLALTESAIRLTGHGLSEAGEAAREHYANLFSPYRFGNGAIRYANRHSRGRGRRPLGSASFWDVDPDKADNRQARVDALLLAAASYA